MTLTTLLKPDTAKMLSDQILTWAKHISDDIPGYTSWQQVYDFTFDALYTPGALPGDSKLHLNQVHIELKLAIHVGH
jgi:hypothetical protein